MNISDYRNDSRFPSKTSAFHAGGIWEIGDEFNRDLLKKKQTGYWHIKEGRIKVGDVIFLTLQSIKKYPYELYGGVVKKIGEPATDDGRRLITVEKFIRLPNIEKGIKEFFNGKVPPQGNHINDVW